MLKRAWAFVSERQRKGARTTLLLCAALAALAVWKPTWQWFPIGLLCLLLLALCVAIAPVRRRFFPGHPVTPWSLLVVTSWLFVIHSYYVELRRQRSERLELLGVQLPSPQARALTVGVDDSVDVRLERASDPTIRWRLALALTPDGKLAVREIRGIDALQQQEKLSSPTSRFFNWLGTRRREWPHVWGAELSGRSPQARLSPEHRFSFQSVDGKPVIGWNRVRLSLLQRENGDPAIEVRNRRLLERLRRGVRISELKWPSFPDSLLASQFALILVSQPREKMGWTDPFGLLPGWEFRITSSESPLPIVERGDSLRVRAGGAEWVLSVDSRRRTAYGTSDLTVGFGRGPSPRLGWLPANEVCRPIDRCTLISSRSLPPTIPHFDIAGFGLDTSRFSFLARVSAVGERYVVVTPEREFTAATGEELLVPARSSGRDQAWYRFRVYKMESGELASLLLTLGGLALMMLGAGALIARSGRVRQLLEQDTVAVNAAWAIASLAVVLLGVRLALGYRVSYAAPYHSRGADTAVGLWVILIVITTALLRWDVWGSRVLDWFYRVERSVRIRTHVTALTVPEQSRWAKVVPRSSGGRKGWLALLTGLALVMYERPGTFAGTVGVVSLTLLAWVLVEYLTARRRTHRAVDTAGTVLSSEELEYDGARWAALALITFGIPLSVLVRDVALVMTVAITAMLLIAAVITRLSSRSRVASPDGSDAPPSRWGAVTMVLLLLTALNLAMLVVEGPTLLFVGVFFLFLLAVRLGHHLGASLTRVHVARALTVAGVFLAAMFLVVTIDFGLVLVVGLPLLVTLLLAVGINRVPTRLAVVVGMLAVVGGFLAWPALSPDAESLATEQTPHETDAAFASLGGPLRHVPGFTDPVRRSVVRGLAAFHPDLLERVLARAAPSLAREEIVPALEQVWGGRAYAASGLAGHGLAGPTVIGRGVPAAVSDAENAFSVYLVAEHGFLGGLAVLAAYIVMAIVPLPVLWSIYRASPDANRPDDTAVAVLVGGILLITVPAVYVAASNLAMVPLTGQNMPFLGLNAWSDVTFVGGIITAILAVLLDTSLVTDSRERVV
jgi:cell division protein FtsW (lipid II flippase)